MTTRRYEGLTQASQPNQLGHSVAKLSVPITRRISSNTRNPRVQKRVGHGVTRIQRVAFVNLAPRRSVSGVSECGKSSASPGLSPSLHVSSVS